MNFTLRYQGRSDNLSTVSGENATAEEISALVASLGESECLVGVNPLSKLADGEGIYKTYLTHVNSFNRTPDYILRFFKTTAMMSELTTRQSDDIFQIVYPKVGWDYSQFCLSELSEFGLETKTGSVKAAPLLKDHLLPSSILSVLPGWSLARYTWGWVAVMDGAKIDSPMALTIDTIVRVFRTRSSMGEWLRGFIQALPK